MMKIGVPKELLEGEKRVAITPKYVKEFRKRGFDVLIESKAGEEAEFMDEEYTEEGAIVQDSKSIYQNADIILKVKKP